MRQPYESTVPLTALPALLSILCTAIVAIVNLPRHILDTATSSENAVRFISATKREPSQRSWFEYKHVCAA